MTKGLDDSNVYLGTVAKLEPDIAMIDAGAFYASAAISLKRVADSLERMEKSYGWACQEEARAEASQDWRQRVALGLLAVAVGTAIGLIIFAGAVVASVLDWG